MATPRRLPCPWRWTNTCAPARSAPGTACSCRASAAGLRGAPRSQRCDAMKLAMVFPGQGSQAVGMLQAYAGLPGVDEVRRAAAESLGEDFVKLLDAGPVESLALTVNTQPAMVTAGYAAYRAWRSLGGAEPEVVAGHSL